MHQGIPAQIQEALAIFKKQKVDFSPFLVLKDGKNYYFWLNKFVINTSLFHLSHAITPATIFIVIVNPTNKELYALQA